MLIIPHQLVGSVFVPDTTRHHVFACSILCRRVCSVCARARARARVCPLSARTDQAVVFLCVYGGVTMVGMCMRVFVYCFLHAMISVSVYACVLVRVCLCVCVCVRAHISLCVC